MERPPIRLRSALNHFISSESAGGICLMVAAALALIVANSPLAETYFAVLHAYAGGLSVLHWINDGLMAIFFVFVGLEIKREFLEGALATWYRRALPGIAALGGVVVPALIYVAFNIGHPAALRGWAIPTATDIAFALGILALLGSRVPPSLKIFLTALAIIDDLAAVAIIAVFYTSDISLPALAGAAATTVVLFALNRFGVKSLLVYLAVGAVLWVFVLKSGIHATVAGVVLALAIPRAPKGVRMVEANSPLLKLEHALAPWVGFLILPVFGFANAGVSFAGVTLGDLMHPLTLGVALGLLLGKQIGVFGAGWLAIRFDLAEMPQGANWRQLYGVALLCGLGFTMSLFIGLLAFDDPHLQDTVKLGVLGGSALAALAGILVLRGGKKKAAA
ncbi:MAG TPA: Na+/H+ antiporter NhaA [Luteibacter sp.]|jgi:NhaA family Na+:H+ antiporter|nr:Na+/H+ antiporter NhaA [Luteibacter sp.]